MLDALERLKGTTITTNILADELEYEDNSGFGLIKGFNIRRSRKTGRILEITVTISRGVFASIRQRQVLTLHKDYFRLGRLLERRVYEIARKHCGQQLKWRITVEKLKNKCGSRGSLKEFNRLLRQMVEGNHLPDYQAELLGNQVVFRNRVCEYERESDTDYPVFDPETYHDAKTVAPGYDVYWLEQEWRRFWIESRPELKNPDAAFIGFCRARYGRNPLG